MGSFEKIYENMRQNFINQGYKVETLDDNKIRQQAWSTLNRKIYSSSGGTIPINVNNLYVDPGYVDDDYVD